MSNDPNIIKIVVVDREGERHELEGPTDMNMNMMELCKSYELPVEGTCGGMAMCASCHMYVTSDHDFRAFRRRRGYARRSIPRGRQ